jgi:hypothetical protein
MSHGMWKCHKWRFSKYVLGEPRYCLLKKNLGKNSNAIMRRELDVEL